MRRVQSCIPGLLLAVTASAWAGGGLYPPIAADEGVSTRTRAEVVGELQEAIRVGRMYDFPVMYADKQALAEAQRQVAEASEQSGVANAADVIVVWGDASVMREKIQAEAAEANRLGLLAFGEGDPPVATAEQEQLIAAAGRRAIAHYWIVGSL